MKSRFAQVLLGHYAMGKGAGTKDLNRAMPGPAHLGRKQKGRFGFMPRRKRKGVAKARNPLI